MHRRTVVLDRLALLNVKRVVLDLFPGISQVLLPSPRFGERGWGCGGDRVPKKPLLALQKPSLIR